MCHAFQVRICIEVDLSIKLPELIWVNKRCYQVTFENCSGFLSHCHPHSLVLHPLNTNPERLMYSLPTLSTDPSPNSDWISNTHPSPACNGFIVKNNNNSIISNICPVSHLRDSLNSGKSPTMQSHPFSSPPSSHNHTPPPKLREIFR